MSVPAANDSPAARTTKTRIAASASTRSQASASASYIAQVSAFRACGRLNVRNAIGPSVWNRASAGSDLVFCTSVLRDGRLGFHLKWTFVQKTRSDPDLSRGVEQHGD